MATAETRTEGPQFTPCDALIIMAQQYEEADKIRKGTVAFCKILLAQLGTAITKTMITRIAHAVHRCNLYPTQIIQAASETSLIRKSHTFGEGVSAGFARILFQALDLSNRKLLSGESLTLREGLDAETTVDGITPDDISKSEITEPIKQDSTTVSLSFIRKQMKKYLVNHPEGEGEIHLLETLAEVLNPRYGKDQKIND